MDSIAPGILNKLFESIVSVESSSDSIKVLSRPSKDPATEVSILVDKSLRPWVLQVDEFVSEADRIGLIGMAEKLGFVSATAETTTENIHKREELQKNSTKDEVFDTAMCSVDSGCRAQDLPDRLHRRLAAILRMDANHTASFQIHRYHSSQNHSEYRAAHHDFVNAMIDNGRNDVSPQILSLMLYLGDSSSSRGGKGNSFELRHHFPQLGIEISQPRPGTALLWPNVFNAEPTKRDSRMVYDTKVENRHIGQTGEDKNYYVLHGAVHMHDVLTLEIDGCLSS